MLSSKVSSPSPPTKSSGGRRVFVEEKSISAHESDRRSDERKVIQSSRNVKVTVRTENTRSRSPDSRSRKLASDRDYGRKSVKDRLGVRTSVESKESRRRHDSWSSDKDRHSAERKRRRSESMDSDRGRNKRDNKHSKDRMVKTNEQKDSSSRSTSSKKTESKSSSNKVLERKVSQLDESGFEPDYNESNSDSKMDSELDLSSDDDDDDSVLSSSSTGSSSPDPKRASKKRKRSERDSSSPSSSKKKKIRKASKRKKNKKHKKHKKEHKKHKHKHEKKDKKKDKR